MKKFIFRRHRSVDDFDKFMIHNHLTVAELGFEIAKAFKTRDGYTDKMLEDMVIAANQMNEIAKIYGFKNIHDMREYIKQHGVKSL